MKLAFLLAGQPEEIVVETSTSLADEVAFEHQFGCSSAVLALQQRALARYNVAVKEAEEAGEEAPDPPANSFLRTEWIAFFGWRSLRHDKPELIPASFDAFLGTVVRFEMLVEDDEEEAPEAPDAELVGASLEATGSGLDPTGLDPQPLDPPSSSSPASTGTP